MKTQTLNTNSVYRTESHRRITDEESGEKRVVLLSEDRPVSATLVTHKGAVFHKGARIA